MVCGSVTLYLVSTEILHRVSLWLLFTMDTSNRVHNAIDEMDITFYIDMSNFLDVSWEGRGVSWEGRGVSREGRGVSREGRGVSREGRGVSWEGRGVSREGRGVSREGRCEQLALQHLRK